MTVRKRWLQRGIGSGLRASNRYGTVRLHARKADPLAETYDEQQEREWLEAAARLTEKQLRTALELCARVANDDARVSDGALVSGIVQAMATNLSTVRRKR
jgi:hypothetical protein